LKRPFPESNALFLKSSLFVSMQALLKTSLRLRPDRIHVGEVRDGAALDLLMAWNTGHSGGISTLHANSAAEGLDRLEQLISIVSQSPMHKLIGAAVDLIIFIKKVGGSRKVIEVLRCSGYDPITQKYNLETVYAA
jgi:type IV secretion system protein VirB11